MRAMLAVAPLVLAAAPPVITELQPRGVQKGRPFVLTVVGRGLEEGGRIESTLAATFTPVKPAGEVGGAAFLVEPAGEMAVGVYPIRVITPNGISNIQLLSVGAFPELEEDESRRGAAPGSNDHFESAQALPAEPLTVNGQLRGAERDVFRFNAKAGERRVIEVEARRAGSAIDPVLELHDAGGKLLARAEDAPLAGLDARLDYTFAKDGFYYVTVHDARYSTQTANYYRLKMGSYDYPQEVFPLGGRRGEVVTVSLGTRQVTADLRRVGAGARHLQLQAPESAALPVLLAVGDDPEVMEGGAEELSLPVTINGRLEKAGEKDRYRLRVTPGEWVTLRVEARELGTSKLMGVVTVLDESGGKIARAGDEPLAEDFFNVNQSRTAGDPVLRFQAPAGVSRVVVTIEDLALRGGQQFGYRLNARQTGQDIRVALNTPYVNVPAGGSAAVSVSVERHGYDGDVQLRVKNAPAGLKVEGGRVVSVAPAEAVNRMRSSPGVLILTAEEGVRVEPVELEVEAVAKVEGREMVRRATGPGMMVAVAGATQQGSVDRQKPLTATWLGRQLPVGGTQAGPAVLEVELVERKRMSEGDQLKFRWKWKLREPGLGLPATVRAELVGAADVRVIEAMPEGSERMSGTFLLTTTKLTRPAEYDFYVAGQVTAGGQQQEVVSRPVVVEILEVESSSVTPTGSGR